MDSKLQGRHVLITGASGGIGTAIAQAFAAEGVNMTLHYNTQRKKTEEIAKKYSMVNSTVVGADLTSEDEVRHLFEEAQNNNGRVDVLVANAGIWPDESTPIQRMSLERWNKTISVDMTSVFLVCREFFLNLEHFVNDFASLVIIGSTAAIFGEAGHVDYAAAKAGIVYGIVRSLKNEIVLLAKRGRVNAICPGWTRTPMASSALQDDSLVSKALLTMPLQKIAEPEDIAHSVVFLSSDHLAGHISGQILTIAGGMEGRVLFPLD